MKKILLSLSILASSSAMIYAQNGCVGDPNAPNDVYPDTLTNFAIAYTGQAYEQDFTVRVPQDTIYQGATVPFSHVTLDNVIGLPQNFTYACDPSTCSFDGGTTNCVEVYSTSLPDTSQIGIYDITIEATPFVLIGVPPFVVPVNAGTVLYEGYELEIQAGGVSIIREANSSKVMSVIAYPNPTEGNTAIQFTAVANSSVTFTVTNLLGEVITNRVVSATRGTNQVNFDASNLSDGVYLYSLTDGEHTVSKKLIVSK